MADRIEPRDYSESAQRLIERIQETPDSDHSRFDALRSVCDADELIAILQASDQFQTSDWIRIHYQALECIPELRFRDVKEQVAALAHSYFEVDQMVTESDLRVARGDQDITPPSVVLARALATGTNENALQAFLTFLADASADGYTEKVAGTMEKALIAEEVLDRLENQGRSTAEIQRRALDLIWKGFENYPDPLQQDITFAHLIRHHYPPAMERLQAIDTDAQIADRLLELSMADETQAIEISRELLEHLTKARDQRGYKLQAREVQELDEGMFSVIGHEEVAVPMQPHLIAVVVYNPENKKALMGRAEPELLTLGTLAQNMLPHARGLFPPSDKGGNIMRVILGSEVKDSRQSVLQSLDPLTVEVLPSQSVVLITQLEENISLRIKLSTSES